MLVTHTHTHRKKTTFPAAAAPIASRWGKMSAPAINPSVPTTAFVNARVLSCVRRDYEKIGGSCSSTSPQNCENGQDEQEQLEHYCGFLVNARTGKILKMFKHASSLKMWKLDAAEIVDLQGKIVIPGLWDSHCHAYSLAHQAKVANLRNLGGADHPQRPGTILDFQKRLVGKYEEILRNGRKVSTFLEGTGWDEADLEGGRLPSRWDLDGCANVGDRKINATNAADVDVDSQLHAVHPELLELPIVCWRRCWHVLVCNSAALKIANITATTHHDVPGVDRDGSNEPTGVLRENATALLQKILGKEDSFHEKVELLRRCVDQMPKAGVTGIQSNDTTLLGQISDAWAVWQAVMEKKTVNDHMLKADFARDGKPLLSLPTDAETRAVDEQKTAKNVVGGANIKAKAACSPPRIGGRSTSTSPPSQLSPYMDERAAPGSPAWRSRAAFSTDPRFNRNPLPVRVAWVAFWDSIPTARRGGRKCEPMPMRPSDNSESAEGSRSPAGAFSPGSRNETVDGQPSELLPTSPDPAFLWSNRAKIILDGSLGASTAALLQPYSDDPANKNCGLLSVTEEEVETALKTVYAANYCLEAHVIGDAAFELLLRVLEKHAVDWHSRLVFTHCQIVNEDLLNRMAQLADREYELQAVDEPRVTRLTRKMHKRIIASVQPQFTNSDLPVVEKKLGKARVATSYVWKRLKNEAKMVVVGGSDAPVEQLCPLAGISDVMRNALHAAENFSLAEALAAYTRDAAWAARRESDLGRLSEGYLADFVVLDLRVAGEAATVEQELARAFTTDRTAGGGGGEVRVARTYVAGKLMYDREHQGRVGDAGDEVTEFVCDTNAPGRGGLPLWRCPCCVNLPTLPSL